MRIDLGRTFSRVLLTVLLLPLVVVTAPSVGGVKDARADSPIIISFPAAPGAQLLNARLTTQDELPGLLQANSVPPSGISSLQRLRDLNPVNFRIHAGTDGGGQYIALPFGHPYVSDIGTPVSAWDFTRLNQLVAEAQASSPTSALMDVRYLPDDMYTNTGPIGSPHGIPGYFSDPSFGAMASYMAALVGYYNAGSPPSGATPWPRPAGVGPISWWEIYNEPDLSMENPRVAPRLPEPPGLSLTAVAGGSLPPAAYCYRIAALDSVGEETTASPEQCLTTAAAGSVNLSWSRSEAWGKDAAGYLVFGRSSASEEYMVFVGGQSGGLTWTDTGAVAPSFGGAVGQLPAANLTGGGPVLSPIEYRSMWDAVVPAMRAVDPSLKLVGPAATNPAGISAGSVVKTAVTSGPADASFLDTRDYVQVLMTSANRPDAISFHGYGGFTGSETEDQMLSRITAVMVPDIRSHILRYSQGLPIWMTEANANAQLDPRNLEVGPFGAAWFGHLFASVGALDPSITNLYQYTAQCPGCSALSLIAERGSPVTTEGNPLLPYWAMLEVNRHFPPGSRLLQVSGVPAGLDVVAVAVPPAFTTVHVMVVNRQPGAGCCGGASLSATVQLGGATSIATSSRSVDAGTDLVRGPAPVSLGQAASVPLTLNGYGLTLLEFRTGGTAAPAPPGTIQAQAPLRVLDTRPASRVGARSAPLGPGESLDLQVPGLPAGSTAAVLNVTVTGTTSAGYLSLFPAGSARPNASSLNWEAGQTVPNLVIAPLGAGGAVSIFNSSGQTDVVADLTGYVLGGDAGAAGRYYPLAPVRIADSRPETLAGDYSGPLLGGAVRRLQVAGRGGVPSAGAAAAVLNLTVTNTSGPGYLTAWPDGSTMPTASSLNWAAGQTTSNRVIVRLSSGAVDLYLPSGSADVVVDVGGWLSDASGDGLGSRYTPVTPVRVLDTRPQSGPIGPYSSPFGPAVSRAVPIAGQGGLPATGLSAVAANVTVTGTTSAGYVSAYPDDASSPPLVSDLNFAAGQTAPILALTRLGSGGGIRAYNLAGSSDLVVDVVGYFS